MDRSRCARQRSILPAVLFSWPEITWDETTVRAHGFCGLWLPLLFAVSACNAGEPVSPPVRQAMPGTGVSVELPPGMVPAAVGTHSVSDSGHTIVNFMAGPRHLGFESDGIHRELLPDGPIEIPGVGNLYRRTRAEHGGGWDGWWLSIVRGDKALAVQAMYTGDSPDEFARLKDVVSSVRWKEDKLDPQLAFGMTTSVPGLKVAQGGFGGLAFTVDGRLGTRGDNLVLLAMPIPARRIADVYPAGCEPAFAAAFSGQSYEGPNDMGGNGIVGCDAWVTNDEDKTSYAAFVVLPSGRGLLQVMGEGDPAELRASLLDLRLTR